MKKIKLFSIFLFLFSVTQVVLGDENPLDRSYNLGILAYNKGGEYVENSRIILESLVGQTNDYPIAFFVLGKIYQKQLSPDYKKAKENFQKSFLYSGKNNKLKLNSLVMMSYLQTDVEAALSNAQEAYNMDRSNVAAQLAYGIALNKKGLTQIQQQEPDKAVTFLLESQKIYPKLVEAKNSLASCYLELIEKGRYQSGSYCPKVKELLESLNKNIPKNKNYQNNITNYKNNLSRFKHVCNENLNEK